jgi:hypothetical protein
MAIPVSELADQIRLALGDLPRGFSVVSAVNDAGEILVNAHPWEWLSRRSTTIDLVADQGYVDAPSDFRDAISMYPTNSLTNHVQWTTLEEINRLRTTVHGTYSGYWAATNYRSVSGAAPVPIIELWPAPSVNSTDYFTLMYHAGWTRVASDNDMVEIPNWLDVLFKDLVRRVAKAWDEEDNADLPQRIQGLKESSLWLEAMRRDGLQQPYLGKTQGGAASPDRQDIGRIYVIDSVASPTNQP